MTDSHAKWLTKQNQKILVFAGMNFIALLTWNVQDQSLQRSFAQPLHKPAIGSWLYTLHTQLCKRHVDVSLLTGLFFQYMECSSVSAHIASGHVAVCSSCTTKMPCEGKLACECTSSSFRLFCSSFSVGAANFTKCEGGMSAAACMHEPAAQQKPARLQWRNSLADPPFHRQRTKAATCSSSCAPHTLMSEYAISVELHPRKRGQCRKSKHPQSILLCDSGLSIRYTPMQTSCLTHARNTDMLLLAEQQTYAQPDTLA